MKLDNIKDVNLITDDKISTKLTYKTFSLGQGHLLSLIKRDDTLSDF